MIKIMRNACLWLAFSAGLACSAASSASNLMDIYHEALEKDAQYQSARAAYQATQEKIAQGRAGFLPSINLSFTRQVQEIDTTLGPAVTIQNRGVVLSATQPI
ncbi:MAG: TolC family protein, partial [Burkholderiales bacterium]|nr:TolC family protein [Burkholderiales bacterium]